MTLPGVVQDLGPAPFTNGVVLSDDEQTLYIARSDNVVATPTDIVAYSRDASGQWDPDSAQVLYVHPLYVGSITVDACGSLYLLEFLRGRVFRLDPSTLAIELVVDLPYTGSYSAIHFAPGIGGWDPNALYASMRGGGLYEFPVGVSGSHVLQP